MLRFRVLGFAVEAVTESPFVAETVLVGLFAHPGCYLRGAPPRDQTLNRPSSLLGASWVVISRVISMVTILIAGYLQPYFN